MKPAENNFAFIDGQNLHLGVKGLGWRLNYKRFRTYLKDKYKVSKAYIQKEMFYFAPKESQRKDRFYG